MNKYGKKALELKNMVGGLCAKYIAPTANEVRDREKRIIEEISNCLGCSDEIATEIFRNNKNKEKLIEICRKYNL